MRLLLIEDSIRLQEALADTLRDAGYLLDIGATVAELEANASVVDYDLIILDLGLPDGDGLASLRSLRAKGNRATVLVITARDAIDDRICGLDSGADDYMIKPFNHAELLARIRALSRRPAELREPIVKVGNTILDQHSGDICTDSGPVDLRPSERRLLALLIRKNGKLLTRAVLEDALSELGRERSTNAIEVLMSRVRRALSESRSDIVIETVRGVGYILRTPG